ncbi:MAG: 3-phosphoshikimate 1-carboxyvinyltransferase [Desulfobacterales bacterium]
MIEIKPRLPKKSAITVPGSKSYTHRILIAAALSNGTCTINNGLRSEDTLLTLKALQQMGIGIEEKDNQLIVQGTNGVFKPSVNPIYLGNSGTSMRLLTAVAALGDGDYILTGTDRMAERPIRDLVDSLNQIGVSAGSVNRDNCPPVKVTGGTIDGGAVSLNCAISSQFLSALLLIAPHTTKGMDITITDGPVSKPYIDMTVDVMQRLGIDIDREAYRSFHVRGGQTYRADTYDVEPDASQASYFWASAAISGASIKVRGLGMDSRQGDVRLTTVFKTMGCTVAEEPDGITVTGGRLSAVDVDMADMPDMVPTLAVVAAFAEGTTTITNVAHLKAKESNRLEAVATELSKMGIDARATDTGLTICGGHPVGAEIETYNDHRIAMSFAITGLMTPGVVITNERCVEKSFPKFWDVFETL